MEMWGAVASEELGYVLNCSGIRYSGRHSRNRKVDSRQRYNGTYLMGRKKGSIECIELNIMTVIGPEFKLLRLS